MYELNEPEEPGDPQALLKLIGSMGDLGGRFLQGVFSTPWTGVPFTLIVLTSLESTFPGITVKFLANLGAFIDRLAIAAGQALSHINSPFNLNPGPGTSNPGPGPHGTTVNFLTSHPILGGPFGNKDDNTLFGAQFRATAFLAIAALTGAPLGPLAKHPIIETGTDQQLYVTDAGVGCSTDQKGVPINGCKLA